MLPIATHVCSCPLFTKVEITHTHDDVLNYFTNNSDTTFMPVWWAEYFLFVLVLNLTWQWHNIEIIGEKLSSDMCTSLPCTINRHFWINLLYTKCAEQWHYMNITVAIPIYNSFHLSILPHISYSVHRMYHWKPSLEYLTQVYPSLVPLHVVWQPCFWRSRAAVLSFPASLRLRTEWRWLLHLSYPETHLS